MPRYKNCGPRHVRREGIHTNTKGRVCQQQKSIHFHSLSLSLYLSLTTNPAPHINPCFPSLLSSHSLYLFNIPTTPRRLCNQLQQGFLSLPFPPSLPLRHHLSLSLSLLFPCVTRTGSRWPWPTTLSSSSFSFASTKLNHRRHPSNPGPPRRVFSSTGQFVSAVPGRFPDTLTALRRKLSRHEPVQPRRSPGAAPPQQAALMAMKSQAG